jgi:arylsulfatase A-like enzyme
MFWVTTPRVNPQEWGRPGSGPATAIDMPFLENCPSPFLARQLIDHLKYHSQGWMKRLYDDYGSRLIYEQMLLRRRSQPLFAFLNWMNVHNRYYPGRVYQHREKIADYDMRGEYDRSLVYCDDRLENLIEVFRRSGDYGQTVFILLSDHGQSHGEYEIWGHGKSLFESELRVPLLFFHGAGSGGIEVDEPVSLVDFKSALEVLSNTGVSDPELMARIKEVFVNGRGVVAEHSNQAPAVGGRPRDMEIAWSFMYISPTGVKLIHDPLLAEESPSWRGGIRFLFDLAADPGERNNLYQTAPRLRQLLLDEYAEWEEAMPPLPDTADEYPAHLINELRALGYIK